MTAMTPVPDDHPLKIAWEQYKATEEFANTRRWAKHENHVEGSLWSAFVAGWDALRTMMENSPVYYAEDEGDVAKILGNTLAEAGIAPKGKPS